MRQPDFNISESRKIFYNIHSSMLISKGAAYGKKKRHILELLHLMLFYFIIIINTISKHLLMLWNIDLRERWNCFCDRLGIFKDVYLNIFGMATILSINPLIFLLEERAATPEELETVVQLIGFIEAGLKQGLDQNLIIALAKDAADWDLSHEGLHYLIAFGLQNGLIEATDVPFEVVPHEQEVIEVSFDIYQFIIDHSVEIFTCLTVGFIGFILYLFRPKNPKPPVTEIKKSESPKEMTREPISKYTSFFKYVITLYASWVLFIRSFFLKEIPWFIPGLLIVLHLNLVIKIFPFYDITKVTSFFLWLGIYLMAVDSLGSVISTYALNNTSNLFDQVLPFLTQPQENVIGNFYRSAGFSALLIGKTAMTATGRAALGVGLISGTGYLINAHLERTHKTSENLKNREAASQDAAKQREWASNESQKQRDWQDQKDRQRVYDSSWNPFKKPPK